MTTVCSPTRSASRGRGTRSRPIGLLLCVLALARAGEARVAADDPQAPNPFGRIADTPLTLETWPLWRRVYVEVFPTKQADRNQERLFYRTVDAFVRSSAGSNGLLPKELAGDAIAWTSLGLSYLEMPDGGPAGPAPSEAMERAEEACRKAVALDQEVPITSYNLACVLVARASADSGGGPPTARGLGMLAEAEDRFRQVRQAYPKLNVESWLGMIALQRGDAQGGLAQLREAALERPYDEWSAEAYLMRAVGASSPGEHTADVSGPFAERFPGNPTVLALHAVALFKDGRLQEAADAMSRARRIDASAIRFLGEDLVARITSQRRIPPQLTEGIRALEAKKYGEATRLFRSALAEDPRDPQAVAGLVRALIGGLTKGTWVPDRSASAKVIEELRGLAERFPKDPSIQAGLAAALHLGGRPAEAGEAIDRVAALGGRVESFFDADSSGAIRSEADAARAYQFRKRLAVGVVAGSVIWVGMMFLMGAVLATVTPRVPSLAVRTDQERSLLETWLERFYLAVLTIGLVIFYASVPVVAAGLLAVTLAVFAVLLMIRILHFGVLHRGLWATWNVLRCSLIGPSPSKVGVEVTEADHPRLFETLREVARKIGTRMVDSVYLTPTTGISVCQEGSGPFGLFGRRRRVLNVGIPVMPLLTRAEFESILAHEYGHFSHRDTFYSRFLFQVSASLSTSLAVMEAAGGVLNYVNPFYWFWWLYLRAYTLISTGFSRSREFLADRRAATAYGKDVFVSGLTKVAVEGTLYNATVLPQVDQLLRQGKSFINAFDAFRSSRDAENMVRARESILEGLNAERPRWFDTHPTFSERLRAVAAFPEAPPSGPSESAISLINDPEALETQLTQLLTQHVHQAMFASGFHPHA